MKNIEKDQELKVYESDLFVYVFRIWERILKTYTVFMQLNFPIKGKFSNCIFKSNVDISIFNKMSGRDVIIIDNGAG